MKKKNVYCNRQLQNKHIISGFKNNEFFKLTLYIFGQFALLLQCNVVTYLRIGVTLVHYFLFMVY